MERNESLKRKIESTKEDLDTSDNEVPAKRRAKEQYVGLLDMPDQIILEIFKHLGPIDLKALGYICERFAQVICDRTLWIDVDYNQPVGADKVHWLLHYALGEQTKSLSIIGLSKNISGCGGHVNIHRPTSDITKRLIAGPSGRLKSPNSYRQYSPYGQSRRCIQPSHLINIQLPLYAGRANRNEPPQPRVCIVAHPFPTSQAHRAWTGQSLNLPQWPTYIQRRLPIPRQPITKCIDELEGCPGPEFTMTSPLLEKLSNQCPNLTSLSLDYCNLNYETLKLQCFPHKLRRLSLMGSVIYNMSKNSTPFLHKVYEFLPLLEYINVSECLWVEPDYVMTFSKLEHLRELVIRDCKNMKDFVAYASLATRNGFRSLEMLDYSGSPVGDSEVSPLGWLPNLTKLYLMMPSKQTKNKQSTHLHYKDDPIIIKKQKDSWEDTPPPYYAKPSERSLEDHKPGQKILREESYQELQETRIAKKVYEMDEDYYVACGYAYEREMLKERYGLDFANFLISDSDSETEETESSFIKAGYDYSNAESSDEFEESSDIPGPLTNYFVTDCAMRYFGQGDSINIVHIDVLGRLGRGRQDGNGVIERPKASPLKVLVCRGYHNVTDSSLTHLVSATPFLEFLDVRGTGVSQRGIDKFKSLRPNVEVIWNGPGFGRDCTE